MLCSLVTCDHVSSHAALTHGPSWRTLRLWALIHKLPGDTVCMALQLCSMLKASCFVSSGCSTISTRLDCVLASANVPSSAQKATLPAAADTLCVSGFQRGDFVPRVPSASSQDSREGRTQSQVTHGSRSQAEADDVQRSSSTTVSRRAGQFGGEVGQENNVGRQSSVGSGQSSSRAGQGTEEAGQGSAAGQGSEEAGQSSNSTSSSSKHIGQSSSGIGRYSSRAQQSPPLHLRESIQGLLNPKQDITQASQLSPS